tara:strand:- start:13704 stop:14852 length:1149 start_codon:yes stop_codon:yes gene_type:complete
MSIIGAPAVGSFSAPTSQVENGGSATYTLDTRVNSAEELEVFVNNVQQEPTVAYSVASDGVSLTFTETTPSGTGTVYFIFRGLAQQHGTDTGAPRLDGNNSFTGNQTITGTVTGGISSTNFVISNGGEITEYKSGSTNYRVHSFLTSGEHKFSVSSAVTVDFLIVAGGGGSAGAEGHQGSTGGGGAGGLVEGTSQSLSAGNYTVVVGAGGAKSTNVSVGASDGGDSSFNGFTATGGAGGGDYEGGIRNGGSGAGGSEDGESGGGTTQDTYSGTTNVTGYGNVGGNGGSYPSGGSGSGGGAGGAGATANGGTVTGGAGRANNFRTGSNVTYSTGGVGQGGDNILGIAGSPNTGNGAGGVSTSSGNNTSGEDGGSGIVVIRYAI